MRVAQVSPLTETVPPVRYGGTERVIFYLTEELLEQGHDVTLFASGDSITNAHLIPVTDKALGYDTDNIERLTCYMGMLEKVLDMSPKFDLIHFHTGRLHYAVAPYLRAAHLTTHHDHHFQPFSNAYHSEYDSIPVVSVSNHQKTVSRNCNWQGTVHYGIPKDLYDFSARHDAYLAYLGQISPDKGILEAIEIARRLDMPLKIAAKISEKNRDFFDGFVKPYLLDPRIEYIGEINNTVKNYFLGDAYALLLPTIKAEPFEIAAIESLACGTPVVAFNNGSIGEIIRHGENGFIVENIESAVKAIESLQTIDRLTCRKSFEKKFTTKRMTNAYLSIYRSLIDSNRISASIHSGIAH